MAAPLEGVRVLEFGAIGPAPFGAMLLSDLGADIIRIDRVRPPDGPSQRALSRNRRSIAVDLKAPAGREIVRDIVETVDVLVEGFRPGVMERLGLGPEELCAKNPELIYARMTGFGQTGDMSRSAGHDINYAALAGALYPIGRAESPPPPPLNLVADFGGGGAFLAIGVLAALIERQESGLGQVLDVAMTDGAALLTTYVHGLVAAGQWRHERAANRLDGAAPYYDTYETSDGKFIAVGASEPQFFREFLNGLGLRPEEFPQNEKEQWPTQKRRIAEVFASKTRREWEETFEGTDACVTPVLEWNEVADHPYHRQRESFVDVDDLRLPAPAPRFERTPLEVRRGAPPPGQDTLEIMAELGYESTAVQALLDADVVG